MMSAQLASAEFRTKALPGTELADPICEAGCMFIRASSMTTTPGITCLQRGRTCAMPVNSGPPSRQSPVTAPTRLLAAGTLTKETAAVHQAFDCIRGHTPRGHRRCTHAEDVQA